jgi:hypothetical protein
VPPSTLHYSTLNKARYPQQNILPIKDLPSSLELDRKAMSAVHGGQDNQAVATSESNVQGMAAAANVGNFSLFCGPTNLQSDNTFSQDADNDNDASNKSLLLAALFGR